MSGHTRKGFLGTGAVAVGGAALAATWRPTSAAAASAAGSAAAGARETVTEGAFDARFYGDYFYFQFAGEGPGGFLQSVDGGTAQADVVDEIDATAAVTKKHVTSIKYNALTIRVGMGQSKGFYDWIKSSFDKKFASRRGTIIATDRNLLATAAADFTDAFITEIGFPALDASSKDPAYMTLKFAPSATHYKPVKGTAPISPPQKPFKTTFKLSIAGLDTSRVTKIDAFTVKRKVTENAVGESRDYELDAETLSIWLEDEPSSIQSWVDFFESFVVQGANSDDKERTGTLQYFDPARQKSLLELTLKNMGIFKLTPEKVESGGESVRRVKAELYCEDIKFEYGPGWA